MALTRASVGSYISSNHHGTGAFTTSSFTPANSSLLTVVAAISVYSGSSDPSSALTISDSASLSWTRRVYIGNSSSWSCGFAVWTAPVTTGTSMTVSVDCGANDASYYYVQVFTWTGYNTSTPTGATATNGSAGTNGALALTLSGAPASDSEVLGVLFKDMNSGTATSTPGTGWTELYDVGVNDYNFLETEVRGSSTSTSVDWVDINDVSGSVAKSIAAALEIKCAAAAASGNPWNYYAQSQ